METEILSEISKYWQIWKNIFWNFGADSLDCGSDLDNLGINPYVHTTVPNY